MITATRYHDFSAGHRVCGHENKCAHLHGHNYRVHFTVTADDSELPLDSIGRVLDFSSIKDKLCTWLEYNWDHKFIIYELDPWVNTLCSIDPLGVVIVPFNPTAENMAKWLLHIIGPQQLEYSGCKLIDVTIEETRKCSASARQ